MSCSNDCFYTDSGLIIDRKSLEGRNDLFIARGNNGAAYRLDDKVIKIVTCECDSEQYDTVSSIKNLSLSNFYKIYDVLSCYNGEVRTFGGTISEYINEDDVDIFLQPTEYLLNSFNLLCDSMTKLGTNYISAFDLNCKNVLVNKDGFFVIDVDLYQKMVNMFSKKLVLWNMHRLKTSVFNDLLQSNFLKFHSDELNSLSSSDFSNMIYDLLNLDNPCDVGVFNNTLLKYKYPIDYVISKK